MQLVPFLKEIYTNVENTRQVTPGGVKASSRGFFAVIQFQCRISFSLLELHNGSQRVTTGINQMERPFKNVRQPADLGYVFT